VALGAILAAISASGANAKPAHHKKKADAHALAAPSVETATEVAEMRAKIDRLTNVVEAQQQAQGALEARLVEQQGRLVA